MNSNAPDTPPNGTALRELIGLALILAGAVAVVTAAFQLDPRAGIALLGSAAVAVGVLMTFREA